MRKNAGKRIEIMFLLGALMIFVAVATGCGNHEEERDNSSFSHASEETEESIQESMSDAAAVSQKQEPVIIDGIEQWTFPYEMKEGNEPIIEMGMMMSRDMVRTELYEDYAKQMNAYLHEQEKGYQVRIHLFAYLGSDAEKRKTAVEQCLDYKCDLIYGSNETALKELSLAENFMDLKDELQNGRLTDIYHVYPEKYWTYIDDQCDGIYSTVQNVPLYGGLKIQINAAQLEKAGVSWEEKTGIQKELDEWDQIFDEIYSQLGEKPFIQVENFQPARMLSFLVPEKDCQVIAPGVGINLEAGEVQKVLDMPMVQEQIERIMNWYQKGWVAEKKDDDRIVECFHWAASNGVFHWNMKDEFGELNTWEYPIAGQLYYPIDLLQGETYFCGIVKDSENIDLAIQLLSDAAADETLQRLWSYDGLGICLVPQIFVTASAEEQYFSGDQEVTLAELTYADYAEAEYASVSGFHFDDSAVQMQVTAVNQVIRNAKEAHLEYANFNSWPEDLEQFEVALEEAGINAIQEEIQKQLDSWKVK